MTQTKNKIKVQVSCLPNCESTVKKIFFEGLEDYCKRFNVKPLEESFKVHICFVEYPDPADYNFEIGTEQGLTIFDDTNNKILIQTRDPLLNDWDENYYTMFQFVCVMMHEFVHAYQHITNRAGIRVKIIHDKTSDKEKYFFDPAEMEARMLELPYFSLYGSKLIV